MSRAERESRPSKQQPRDRTRDKEVDKTFKSYRYVYRTSNLGLFMLFMTSRRRIVMSIYYKLNNVSTVVS